MITVKTNDATDAALLLAAKQDPVRLMKVLSCAAEASRKARSFLGPQLLVSLKPVREVLVSVLERPSEEGYRALVAAGTKAIDQVLESAGDVTMDMQRAPGPESLALERAVRAATTVARRIPGRCPVDRFVGSPEAQYAFRQVIRVAEGQPVDLSKVSMQAADAARDADRALFASAAERVMASRGTRDVDRG